VELRNTSIAMLADRAQNRRGKPDEGLITDRSRDAPFSIFTGISDPSVLRTGRFCTPLKDGHLLALSG
jgi:hypothetical protein